MNRPVVIVRLCGGLGNQLFQYSFGRALAIRNGAPLALDTVSGFLRDTYRRTFDLEGFSVASHCVPAAGLMNIPLSRWRRQWWGLVAATQPLHRRRYVRERSLTSWDPAVAGMRLVRPTYFDGFWQHEEYLRDARPQLLQDLSPSLPFGPAAAAIARRIDPNRTVCVHLRCLRHAAVGSHDAPRLTIDPGYYARAAAEMCRRIDRPSFLVFSDHPQWARSQGFLPEPADFLPDDGSRTATEDVCLMSQCRNFIIGNSTFSWWGAWLSRHEGKHVIAPRSGIGHGIHSVPPGWHLD